MAYNAAHPALPTMPFDFPSAAIQQGDPLQPDDVVAAHQQKKRRMDLANAGAATPAEAAAASIREQAVVAEHVAAAGGAAAGAPAWGIHLVAQINQQNQQQNQQIQQMNQEMNQRFDQVDLRIDQVNQNLESRTAYLANVSASRLTDVLLPVANANGMFPADVDDPVWFPNTVRELTVCSPVQANALLGFYNVPADGGPGAVQARKIIAIERVIGLRER